MRKTLILFGLFLTLSGCGLKEYKRGHLLTPEESDKVSTLRTKSDILKMLGTPGGTNIYGTQDIWMYLSYEKEQTAFFEPTDTKFDLIVFYFNKGQDRANEIKRYDLSQKIAYEPDSQTTPIPGAIELSPLQELFNNIGRFSPATTGQ